MPVGWRSAGLGVLGIMVACSPGPTGASALNPESPGGAGAAGGGTVTARNINVLHGLFCGFGQCRQAERVELLFEWLTRGACPDIITLQEVSLRGEPLLRDAAERVKCPFPYEYVFEDGNGFDDSAVLSRYPVVSRKITYLYGGFRHVLHVVVEHPLGMLNVLTTHLASSADGASDACAEDCPDVCVVAGARTRRECQAAELRALSDSTSGMTLVTGDFNAEPGSFELRQLSEAGFLDTAAQAGLVECQPRTGAGCTSGRDSSLEALEDPAMGHRERIDYILARNTPVGGSPRLSCHSETGPDGKEQGLTTALFAHTKNPFSPTCGASPSPPCWPSDHAGNELRWRCGQVR